MFKKLFTATIVFLSLLVIARPNFAHGETVVQADLTKKGVFVLQETTGAGETLKESRLNLSYAKGYTGFLTNFLQILLYTISNTSREQPSLNKAAFNNWLNNASVDYLSNIRAAVPRGRVMAADGTLGGVNPLPYDIDKTRLYFRRMGNPERALEAQRDSTMETRDLAVAWLRGAQQAAEEKRTEIYNLHPSLASTKIIEAFGELTEIDIFEGLESHGSLYDEGGLSRNLGAIAAWPTAGTLKRPETVASLNTSVQFAALPLSVPMKEKYATPLGASNAAAITYQSLDHGIKECLVSGEPHQPNMTEEDFNGPGFRFMTYCNYPRDNGVRIPMLTMHYTSTLSGAALMYRGGEEGVVGPRNGNSGTAAPTGQAWLFYAKATDTHYLDENSEWQPFEVETVQGHENGVARSVDVFSIPGFGTVVRYFTEPESGEDYVLTMRKKSAALFLDSLSTREKAMATNDPDLFQEALFERSTAHWGEAGCAPASDGNGSKNYFVNHQGRIDQVEDPYAVDVLYINPVISKLKKTGTIRSIGQYDQPYVSSDNGSLKSGIDPQFANPVNNIPLADIPSAWDPGGETPRQKHVLDFGRNRTLAGALSDQEVVEFATSTYSASIQRLTSMAAAAIFKHGATTIPEESLAVMQSLMNELSVFDGLNKGRFIEIIIFHAQLDVRNMLYNSAIPLTEDVRRYLRSEDVSFEDAYDALDEASARVLNTEFLDALQFYLNECLANGIVTWKEAVRVEFRGEVVIPPNTIAGPGPFGDSRLSGSFRFKEVNGQKICELLLEGSSPMSHLFMNGQVYILPYGSPVSMFNLFGGDPFYVTTINEWFKAREKQNTGTGYAGVEGFVNVCPMDVPYEPGAVPELVQTVTVRVPELLNRSEPTPSPSPTATPTPEPSPTTTPTGMPSVSPTPEPSPTTSGTPDPCTTGPDSDSDAVSDVCDRCPQDPGKVEPGSCGCGTPDADLNSNGAVDCDLFGELFISADSLRSAIKRLRPIKPEMSKRRKRRAKERKRFAKAQFELFSTAGTTLSQSGLSTQSFQGNYSKALKFSKKALKIRRSAFRKNRRKALRRLATLMNSRSQELSTAD